MIKKYIQNGSVQDIWWNVKDLGYLTYYGAQALAQCKITGKEGDKFTAGRLGEYTVGAEGRSRARPGQDRHPGQRRRIQVLATVGRGRSDTHWSSNDLRGLG